MGKKIDPFEPSSPAIAFSCIFHPLSIALHVRCKRYLFPESCAPFFKQSDPNPQTWPLSASSSHMLSERIVRPFPPLTDYRQTFCLGIFLPRHIEIKNKKNTYLIIYIVMVINPFVNTLETPIIFYRNAAFCKIRWGIMKRWFCIHKKHLFPQ